MVDPSQPTQQSDTEMLAVPKELALSIREIIYLYHHHNKQNVLEAVRNMIAAAKDDQIYPILKNQNLTNYSHNSELENDEDFRKSWDDILNVQVYIDTEIFGELDPRPPALVEINSNSVDSETVIQHTEATEAYVQAWKELAQNMSSFPDDLFTRLWTTIEIAKIVECSPSSLRRARRSGRLPIRIKNLILDCISHDGKRSLWFVRPA
ncbi:helix-turn-helix transcriptional regulator [Pseudanabaena yagii]|uniref:Uncharacterized protein n=1 Tax=Pseudanabaena yagii GIHE-NHR1 TaxID=2722753 RepID=A0ABX1LKF0_9CYAN|nr:hypothetical protein [Pseudanabaena yagii]NMF56553.1 hypothetical protein [Pseudanabaena yagii GIHE-NHR1]